MQRFLSCGLLLLAMTATGRPDEPGDKVAQLVQELGSPEFAARERAGTALEALGDVARLPLEQAANHKDPEIKLRARAILQKLYEEDIWSPSLVSYKSDRVLASEALLSIAKQSGNRVIVSEPYGTFREAVISIDQQNVPFWQALDEVCRLTKHQPRHHYDSRNPGLVFEFLQFSGSGQYPTAYAGPVKAKILIARRVFIEEFDYENLTTDITHTFQFNLDLMWEHDFRVVAYRVQPELLEATLADGTPVTASQAPATTWSIASNGTREISTNLKLRPCPLDAGSLSLLRLKWGLIAVGALKTITVTDLNSKAPHYQDDVELTIAQLNEKPGNRYELVLEIRRDRVAPEPSDIVFQENEVELFDESGTAFKKQGQTNALTDQGATIRFTFAGETATSSPKTLQFTYPRLRSQKDLEIIFRDVPLPSGRPE